MNESGKLSFQEFEKVIKSGKIVAVVGHEDDHRFAAFVPTKYRNVVVVDNFNPHLIIDVTGGHQVQARRAYSQYFTLAKAINGR